MKTKTTLREAVVLLCVILMVIPAGIALGNANTHNLSAPQAPKKTTTMVWDNVLGYHGALGGIVVATCRTEGSSEASDDFQLDQAADITHIVWQGGYFQTQLAQGDHDYFWPWNFVFWSSAQDGTHPDTQIYNMTVDNSSITREFWYNYTRPDTGNHYYVMNYSCDLPQAFHAEAGVKYWISIRGIGAYPPQACWCRHNDSFGGIKLNEAVFRGVIWGYTDWIPLHQMAPDGLNHDLNFQLYSTTADTTPPVTTCTLDGNLSGGVYITPVTVTLTATDASGVAYTKYSLDGSAFADYTAPFTVTAGGTHTLKFYSADTVGNIEPTNTVNFTIQSALQLTIGKGLGFTVSAKNNLGTDMTSVAWSYTVTGGIVLVGASGSGTIPTLAAGATKKIHAFPIGFGPVTFTVTVGGNSANATAFLLLFLTV